jgi:transcriptional regulator with XRE-family HTH domain
MSPAICQPKKDLGCTWVAVQNAEAADEGATSAVSGVVVTTPENCRDQSQADLAAKVGTDPGQISRYENGRMTPSAEAVARLAEVLDVSCDYLLIEDSPRRPLHSPEDVLGDRLGPIAELDDDDRRSLLNVIDALVTKSRLKVLTGGLDRSGPGPA